MGSMSNYLESGIIQHFLRTGSISKPSTLAVALCSGLLDDTNTGANLPEMANTGGYARVDLTAPSNSIWDYQGLTGATQNTSQISFPAATADWGVASGIAIVDNATYGAGNVLLWGYLTRRRDVLDGDTFSFGAGNIDFTLD